MTSLAVTVCESWATALSLSRPATHGDSSGGSSALSGPWPTPRATDGTKGGPNQRGRKGDLMLPSAASQWQPPKDAA